MKIDEIKTLFPNFTDFYTDLEAKKQYLMEKGLTQNTSLLPYIRNLRCPPSLWTPILM